MSIKTLDLAPKIYVQLYDDDGELHQPPYRTFSTERIHDTDAVYILEVANESQNKN